LAIEINVLAAKQTTIAAVFIQTTRFIVIIDR